MLNVVERFRGLFRWTNRDDWREAVANHRDVSVNMILEISGLTEDELFDRLGQGLAELLLVWVELDFLTTVRVDGLNPVDEYLERRGFKESTGNRALMQTVRNSVPSLYEIVEKRPDGCYRLQDLLRDGDPVEVVASLPEGAVGTVVALRVVVAMGRLQCVGPPLPFPTAVMAQTLDHFRESLATVDIGSGGTSAPVPDLTDVDRRLRAIGPAFVLIWILSIVVALKAERKHGDDVDADDVDPAEPHAVEFPYLDTTTEEAIRQRLDADGRLRKDGPTIWMWAADPAFDADDPDQDVDVFTFDVTIEGRAVVAVVMNGLFAEEACAVMEEILAGLVDEPVIAPLDLDSLFAGLDEADLDVMTDDATVPGRPKTTKH